MSSSSSSPRSSSSPSPSPVPEDLKPHKRRTKFMIAQENKQILDYIIGGATHDQIRKWVGLNEKNYWKRIAATHKKDLELIKAEQTPEAHAFLYKRTDKKLHNLEVTTMRIVESKTAQTKDLDCGIQQNQVISTSIFQRPRE